MSDRDLSPATPAVGQAAKSVRAGRWLVVALALVVLAGCEHGNLSFNRDTGQFGIPIGAGSRENQ